MKKDAFSIAKVKIIEFFKFVIIAVYVCGYIYIYIYIYFTVQGCDGI